MMRRIQARLFILAMTTMVTLVPTTSGPQATNLGGAIPGQSHTLLPDGRSLWLGGQGPQGGLDTGFVSDPRSQVLTGLPDPLRAGRAWHSATTAPDGTVLITGGQGLNGIVHGLEIFDPKTATFVEASVLGFTARAGHTATVLTDGRLFISGGVTDSGGPAATAELWDLTTGLARVVSATMATARYRHSATLLGDGRVLLWGGLDAMGRPLADGELFDPVAEQFVPADAASLPGVAAVPHIAGSLPWDGATDVLLETTIALRFSSPLRMETVTPSTVSLSGAAGPEPIGVVPVEGGRLAFIHPPQRLRPGTRYTVSVDGAVDREGRSLEPGRVTFTTQPRATATVGGGPVSPPTESQLSSSGSQPTTDADDERWIPARPGADHWRTGRPDSPWPSLPPLRAADGVTALAGQVLRLNGQPLANVTLAIGPTAVRTDDTGRFLLTGAAPGTYALTIDGRTANAPGHSYGRFSANVELKAGETTALPYTIWMPALDTQHAVAIPRYTTHEVVVTTPRIPGLELRIPPQTAIRDEDGQPVTEISITPVPLDRPPFPLPQGVEVPLYFTIQPGGAYLYSASGAGAALVYPNAVQAPAATKFQFWNYEAERRGWFVYGLGTVSADGRQVVPDPGVRLYELTAAMVQGPGSAPPEGPAPGAGPEGKDGDPVDLGTGLFVLSRTDLVLPDVLPIVLTRTYRPRDTIARAFGIGTTHPYDIFLVGNTYPFTWQELILVDGGRIHYDRISAGTGWADAVYEHTATPTKFYKSRLAWNGTGWTITLKDGTALSFPESGGATRPQGSALLELRDRFGNPLVMTRDANRNLTRITAPSGRTLDFTYDAGSRVIQAKDLLGRTVTYAYDASGRLTTVTDPAGGVTHYTYDASGRMLTLTDARGITFLTNEYDAAGRVTRQTQADGTTYQFAYSLDPGTGKITQTDVTDPRGNVRRVTFDTAGYPLTDTRGLGTAVAQTTTYGRQAGSHLVTAITDPLARQTTTTYDAFGNLTSLTRLAGTPDAVTTSFAYEPVFNQLGSVTDPLGHTTTFAYDTRGALTTVTDALGHAGTFTTNEAGQPVAATTPAGTTTLGYLQTDLTGVTDPVGNVTRQFVDLAGRVATRTTPLGDQTQYAYDNLNRVTAITDPLGGITQFGYDANSNLLTVTDARGNATTYTYNNMDRVATRTDLLLRVESYAYDANGNLATFTDRRGQATGRTYDALDRPTQATYADGSTTSYTWDAENRLTQLVDSINGTISRTYDGLDRLTQETTPEGSVTYTYDAAGRRTSLTVAGQPTVSYSYDAANRLTGVTQGSTVVGLTYDAANRRTQLTLPNGTSTEYTYDAGSRLTGLTYKSGAVVLGTFTYAYDGAGNRRIVGGSWARTGLPAPLSGAVYNAANQPVAFGAQTLTYDLNGNLASDGVSTYTWDARNQLAAVAGPTSASFAYDGLGRRRSKAVNGTTISFLYDGLNTVQEQYGATVANLLTGLHIDEFYMRADAAGSQTYFTDALGSTVALTDATGGIQATYTYEPFGATVVTGSTNNSYDFTGRESDGTGLKYYRARYYHPTLQRFISNDPLEFEGGDTNLYAYTGNRPVIYRDSLGLFVWAPGAVGFGVGALGGALGAIGESGWTGGSVLAAAGAGGVAGFFAAYSTPLGGAALGAAANAVGQLAATGEVNLTSLAAAAATGALASLAGNALNAGAWGELAAGQAFLPLGPLGDMLGKSLPLPLSGIRPPPPIPPSWLPFSPTSPDPLKGQPLKGPGPGKSGP